MTIDLSTYLSRIPQVRDADPATCLRLGGLTNLNYLVQAGADRYVVRVPGAGTSEYVNRIEEEVAARSAGDAGVNAEVIYFNSTDGLMMTRFVEGATTMSSADFDDLTAVGRAGEVFRRLHDNAKPFASSFRLFDMIDGYKTLLASRRAVLPEGYDGVQRQAESLRSTLAAHPVKLVASHCDPLCENFLDTGQRMFLIDYEYAGNNDPMWDLGDLSVEGGFTNEQDQALLTAYFGGQPPDAQVGRMVAYKALCDLLWTLWGVIQHVNRNPAEDFWAYAIGRFTRCRSLLESRDFWATVAAANRPR